MLHAFVASLLGLVEHLVLDEADLLLGTGVDSDAAAYNRSEPLQQHEMNKGLIDPAPATHLDDDQSQSQSLVMSRQNERNRYRREKYMQLQNRRKGLHGEALHRHRQVPLEQLQREVAQVVGLIEEERAELRRSKKKKKKSKNKKNVPTSLGAIRTAIDGFDSDEGKGMLFSPLRALHRMRTKERSKRVQIIKQQADSAAIETPEKRVQVILAAATTGGEGLTQALAEYMPDLKVGWSKGTSYTRNK